MTRAGVLDQIAARRAADVAAELGDATYRDLARAADAAPPPRDATLRLARPGLHLIAEVKRSSPSAGAIDPIADPVARARAYEAGGASVISVLCEPHWFGGSVADLRAVRAAVAVPVLAKEFVVDARQLPVLRAAGADLVLLLAALHPARRLADLAARARDLGLEPLVEVHAEREIDAALASGARLIGVNSRNLRTLAVDPDEPIRLRSRIPDDRLAIAESGARDPATVARWRAAGYDAALVGEALVRAADPRAAAAAFVAAGAVPDDPGAAHRIPLVKICGVVDDAGLDAALAANADAIGLNFVAGTPRALTIAEGAALARRARAAGGTRTPTHRGDHGRGGRHAARGPRRRRERRRDPVRRRGVARRDRRRRRAPPGRSSTSRRRLRTRQPTARPSSSAPSPAPAPTSPPAPRASSSTRPADPTRAAPARAPTPRLAAAVAREVPVILAGGLNPGTVAGALLAVPAVGVDVASGVEAPRAAGERPRKDPLAVALLAKRARAARFDRPNVASGPTPVHPGLLEADARGHWGAERDFGGRFVPETLVGALEQLEAAYAALRHDPVFWAELRELLARFAGRPTALYRADRLAAAVLDGGRPPARARLRHVRPRARHARRRPATPHPPCRLPQARGPRPHRGPQDQQRPRSGAAYPSPGQDPGDRRDRGRAARRGHGHRLRPPGPALRRVHGRGGHPAPGPERPPDARPGRRGPLRHLRHGHPEGRRQRGDARLGHERRHDPLRPGQRDGPPSVPHDRPRPPAPDRRRGGRAAARGRGAPARPRPRLRRGWLERDRAPGPLHRRAVRAPGGGRGRRRRDRDGAPRGGDPGRDAGDPPRLALAHAPGPRRPGRRGGERLGGARLPGRRPAARGPGRSRPDLGGERDRPRGGGGNEGGDTDGGDPSCARDGPRDRRAAEAAGGRRRPTRARRFDAAAWPDETLVLVGFSGRGDKDLAALERFADVEPWEGVR